MLFHSHLFLFVFLPLALAGYALLARITTSTTPPLLWLVLASLVFYAFWDVRYTFLLIASVLVNFGILSVLYRMPIEHRYRFATLAAGIVLNLLLLGSFKYVNFVLQNVNALLQTNIPYFSHAFPVGISFYTFIQIGCLVDAYNGQVERLSFVKYALFGTFFPYITAGPLVQQREMFQQMDVPVAKRFSGMHVAVGLTMVLMGLFKKLILADALAPYANTIFTAAGAGTGIGPVDAWLGVFAYTFQLYFDFSGYSDMALGLGYMFGLRLPLNFHSPLKATNLIDFWRRWHMTMTRFFTNYLYTPFATAGMRRSIQRRYSVPRRLLVVVVVPVILTFTLAGLWHGPGWGFVIFGLIHGVALAINHAWREAQGRSRVPRIPTGVSWALTVLVFAVSLVFFRATSVESAAHLVQAMIGAAGGDTALPADFYRSVLVFNRLPTVPLPVWLLILSAIVLLFPNTNEILKEYDVALDAPPRTTATRRIDLTWRPTIAWSLAIGLVAIIALAALGEQSPFLYYQF
jgi:alginate O-acetyltransferase complex protein AlgI